MSQRSATVFRDFLLLPLVWVLVVASCSSKKEDSSSEPFATLIESQVAPVAEFTGGGAVGKFSPQESKNEVILDELRAKHASQMQGLQGFPCKTNQEASQKTQSPTELQR